MDKSSIHISLFYVISIFYSPFCWHRGILQEIYRGNQNCLGKYDKDNRGKMKNKKGVSVLIAVVLLILITVSAVGIIWGAIMPIINEISEHSQNQTLNQTENQSYNQINPMVINHCKETCEELNLEYHKAIDGINPNPIGYGCFCRWHNGYGDNYIRIW